MFANKNLCHLSVSKETISSNEGFFFLMILKFKLLYYSVNMSMQIWQLCDKNPINVEKKLHIWSIYYVFIVLKINLKKKKTYSIMDQSKEGRS